MKINDITCSHTFLLNIVVRRIQCCWRYRSRFILYVRKGVWKFLKFIVERVQSNIFFVNEILQKFLQLVLSDSFQNIMHNVWSQSFNNMKNFKEFRIAFLVTPYAVEACAWSASSNALTWWACVSLVHAMKGLETNWRKVIHSQHRQTLVVILSDVAMQCWHLQNDPEGALKPTMYVEPRLSPDAIETVPWTTKGIPSTMIPSYI